jgi:uroporphyrinogen decarboxylase
MEEGKDFYFNQKFHPLEAYEDITDVVKRFKMPDIAAYKEEILHTWDSQIAEASKEAGFVADRICAGLTEMFFRYRGYEKGLMDMVLYPEESREILEQIADYKIQYWDLFGDYIKQKGLEDSFLVVSECDDLGTQQSLLMSQDMLRQIVFPPMRRYLGFIKNKMPNAKIFFHCDGSIKKIIPDFIEMGIDILNPVQYTAFDMDLFELKKNFGSDVPTGDPGSETQGTMSRV